MKDFVFSSKSELMSALCSQFSGLCIFQGRGVTMRKPWSKIFFDEKMPRSSCCFTADLICWSRSCALDVFVTDGPISHTQMDSYIFSSQGKELISDFYILSRSESQNKIFTFTATSGDLNENLEMLLRNFNKKNREKNGFWNYCLFATLSVRGTSLLLDIKFYTPAHTPPWYRHWGLLHNSNKMALYYLLRNQRKMIYFWK